jgi:hypothetical protein
MNMENVPIYVKVDKYKELLEVLRGINAKLGQVDKTVEKINALKSQEEAQLQAWSENLNDIRSRLERINNAFYDG